jgi:hypothetical protein
MIGSGTAWREWVDWEITTELELRKGLCRVRVRERYGLTPEVFAKLARRSPAGFRKKSIQRVQGVRGNNASPGEYRRIQNHLVNLHTGEKTYTPPPPLEVPEIMTDFVSRLQKYTQIHPVIVADIAQFPTRSHSSLC